MYTREAFQQVITWLEGVFPRVIILAHVKDVSLDKDGSETTIKDLDLTGRLKRIIAADSDAIGYIYRDVETGNNYINFGNNESVLTGSRIPDLQGNILISEIKEGKVVTYWETIYPSIKEMK